MRERKEINSRSAQNELERKKVEQGELRRRSRRRGVGDQEKVVDVLV